VSVITSEWTALRDFVDRCVFRLPVITHTFERDSLRPVGWSASWHECGRADGKLKGTSHGL